MGRVRADVKASSVCIYSYKSDIPESRVGHAAISRSHASSTRCGSARPEWAMSHGPVPGIEFHTVESLECEVPLVDEAKR